MPTTRFCAVIGVPERTWRRWQARTRTGAAAKGPWPRPARMQVREAARGHALAHPAWGHRKVWAMCRHDGLAVSATSVLRLLRGEGLLLEANYQRERRQLAARRKAAFAVEPTAPNQVWQLDFTFRSPPSLSSAGKGSECVSAHEIDSTRLGVACTARCHARDSSPVGPSNHTPPPNVRLPPHRARRPVSLRCSARACRAPAGRSDITAAASRRRSCPTLETAITAGQQLWPGSGTP